MKRLFSRHTKGNYEVLYLRPLFIQIFFPLSIHALLIAEVLYMPLRNTFLWAIPLSLYILLGLFDERKKWGLIERGIGPFHSSLKKANPLTYPTIIKVYDHYFSIETKEYFLEDLIKVEIDSYYYEYKIFYKKDKKKEVRKFRIVPFPKDIIIDLVNMNVQVMRDGDRIRKQHL